MYQLNFSNQSITELNKLEKIRQMELVEALSGVTPERLKTDQAAIGTFQREGKIFYRLRVDDFRLYFEVSDEDGTIFCYHILHKHSVADFAFRMRLPLDEEEIERHQSFWQYLKGLTK
jgi:mRNA interferase RelE/StbE